MNIFQFDEDYFGDAENKDALAKLEFWTWMLEQQQKRGVHLLPPFINFICNTNDEPPIEITFEDGEDSITD